MMCNPSGDQSGRSSTTPAAACVSRRGRDPSGLPPSFEDVLKSPGRGNTFQAIWPLRGTDVEELAVAVPCGAAHIEGRKSRKHDRGAAEDAESTS